MIVDTMLRMQDEPVNHTQAQNLVTGDCPYGPLHLGHYIGTLKTRVLLQDQYKSFFVIADFQALNDQVKYYSQIKDNVYELMADYLAAGLKPSNSFVLQSQVVGLARISLFLSYLTSLSLMTGNPVVKKTVNTGSRKITAAHLNHPISQAADMLAFRANVVPVGNTQISFIEFARKLARKFNSSFQTDYFPEPRAILSNCPSLIGYDGKSHMSRTMNNAIYINDSLDTISSKIRKMPSNPDLEKSIVFKYHRLFNPNEIRVCELESLYLEKKIGDEQLKMELVEVLDHLIAPIRERREELLKDKSYLSKILRDGTEYGQSEVSKTMESMRQYMKIDYGWN